MNDRIILENVSKFYGEVLGVNRVSLTLPPGITSLVGPNGSGKTTLMNLMTGLIQPTRGTLSVLGLTPLERIRILPARRLLHSVRFLPARYHGMGICIRQSPLARHLAPRSLHDDS